jgi:hypothetical protein
MKSFTRNRLSTLIVFLGWCLLARSGHAQPSEVDPQLIHAQWNSLLLKYVSATGRVNYKGFIADRARLESYLQLVRKTAPDAQPSWTADDKKAFWKMCTMPRRCRPLRSITPLPV